jgi:hypothetical protein
MSDEISQSQTSGRELMSALPVHTSPDVEGRPLRFDPRTLAVLSMAAGVQVDALESVDGWLAALPVEESVREDIFEMLCLVTGQVIDKLVLPPG